MDNITLLIAAYGAAVSTAAIFWEFKVWRDRTCGRVKIFVADNMMTYSEVDGHEGPFVIFEAVNDGEKPVIISAIWIAVRGARSSFWLKNLELPKKLCEGETFAHPADRKQFLVQLGLLGLKPPWKCKVIFRSTVGRKYKRDFVISV